MKIDNELTTNDKVRARSRRAKNWWEPMFSGPETCEFTIFDWNFENNSGPRNYLMRAEDFKNPTSTNIRNITFTDCDFQGTFETPIIFNSCRFTRCDFGLSTFHRAKFTNCFFDESSFSQTILQNCELRNCEYQNISFSGNETQLPKTLITEPDKFVFGGNASLRNLPKGKSQNVQKLRFEETRSTLSRVILANLQAEGSEETYYKAVRTASFCEDRASIARGLLKIYYALYPLEPPHLHKRFLSGVKGLIQCISSFLSLCLLAAMGFLNGWGGNLSRVISIGLSTILSISYWMSYNHDLTYKDSLIKTCEVFFLFGYSNHTVEPSDDFLLLFSTAFLGVFWYALAIPTIVNRLTRLRG